MPRWLYGCWFQAREVAKENNKTQFERDKQLSEQKRQTALSKKYKAQLISCRLAIARLTADSNGEALLNRLATLMLLLNGRARR